MYRIHKARAERELFRVLQNIFQASELRRFLRHRTDYALLCNELPSEEASSNTVTDAAVQALDKHGLITRRLFDELLEERPHRSDEIQRVAAIWDALETSFPKQAPLNPSGPITFANISIDLRDPNWREIANGSSTSLCNRPCSQRFILNQWVSDADPLYDVTILNAHESPAILTAIGIQFLTVCDIKFRGIPQAARIPKIDSYTLSIPEIKKRLYARGWHGIEPMDVQETIIEKLPDPIYLESKAPYRYGLLLKNYWRNIPTLARIRIGVAADQGESWSSELEMGY